MLLIWSRDKVLISSMFYKQLLCKQIPKAQKKTDNLTVSFVLSGSACVKATSRTLMKLTLGCNEGVKVYSKDELSKVIALKAA